jgi:hypothetical protein
LESLKRGNWKIPKHRHSFVSGAKVWGSGGFQECGWLALKKEGEICKQKAWLKHKNETQNTENRAEKMKNM